MKQPKLTLSILYILFLFAPSLMAQTAVSQKIVFNLEPIRFNKNSNGFEPLYKFVSDTIRYRGVEGIMTFPNNFIAQDTGYCISYFTGYKTSTFRKSVMVLVANYKSDSPIFYIDSNGNLDFNDDGTPIKTKENGDAILVFKSSKNPEGKFLVRFYRRELDEGWSNELKRSHAKPGPMKNGAFREKLKYGFSNQRMAVKEFRGEVNGQKLKLGLFDWDCDGLFAKNKKDRLMIQFDTAKEFSHKPTHGAVLLKDTSLLVIGGQQYEITEVEESGKYLILEPSTLPFDPPITVGQKLKNYDIPMKDGLVPIMSFLKNKEYILVDVWGSWCGGCTQQLPYIKRLDSIYFQSINIIGLNRGDTEEKMDTYIKKHEIKWPNGKLSDEIKSDLRIEGFPSYLLIDSSGKLVLFDNLWVIEEYLKKNTKTKTED